MKKGQESIAIPFIVLFTVLMLVLSGFIVSEESIDFETHGQADISLTEFKTLIAMNALVKTDEPGPKNYFYVANDYQSEDVESTAEEVFEQNKDNHEYFEQYMSIEGTDIEVGKRDNKLLKSIYLASPEGPRLMEVGGER